MNKAIPRNKPVILDCTLRDGGYYNNWDFEIKVAKEYISAMTKAKVNIVEIGFRSLKNTGYKGPFAFSSDSTIKEVKGENDIDIATMVDVKELANSESIEESLETLYPHEATKCGISYIRLASMLRELKTAALAAKILKGKGYKVCINLMQAASITEAEIQEGIKSIRHCELAAFYLADSTGSLSPKDYGSKIKYASSILNCQIGIHAHDNMGKALESTLNCLELGATWLDSTVLGMGRGPGNTDTEELILTLHQKQLIDDPELLPLFKLSEQYFQPLKSKFKWGKNKYYFISGMHEIHPSYVQEMLGDTRYHQAEIIGALNFLKTSNAKSFEAERLLDARTFYKGEKDGRNSLSDYIKADTAIIIGSGPSAKNNKNAINEYIRTTDATVAVLNNQKVIDEELVDLRAVCHPMRLLADSSMLAKSEQTILTPYSMLPDDLRRLFSRANILDYGLKVRSNTFESNEFSCTIPYPLAISYTLAAVGSVPGVKKIILAGFDGYQPGDPRNMEMENILELYMKQYSNIDLFSVTLTCYNQIRTESIHGLIQ